MAVFLLNEVGDLSIFVIILLCYSSPLCCKTLKKGVAGKKVFAPITRGHKIVSARSRNREI